MLVGTAKFESSESKFKEMVKSRITVSLSGREELGKIMTVCSNFEPLLLSAQFGNQIWNDHFTLRSAMISVRRFPFGNAKMGLNSLKTRRTDGVALDRHEDR